MIWHILPSKQLPPKFILVIFSPQLTRVCWSSRSA